MPYNAKYKKRKIMGHRITQRIHECSQCSKIPEDGEYMWYMGDEIWCEECCDKEEDEDEENDE